MGRPDAVLSCTQCLALFQLRFTIAGASRVLITRGKGEASELSMLLQQGRKLKDYSRLMAYLKGLTPSRLDSELRFMQVCGFHGRICHADAHACMLLRRCP